jgi:hypothetical protein
MDKMEEGTRPPLQYGQIKHIEEILTAKEDLQGQSVRVLGKLVTLILIPPPLALAHGLTHYVRTCGVCVLGVPCVMWCMRRVVEFDIPSNRVVLESPHGRTHRLAVDTRLLEAMPLATHSLFQVIGELRRATSSEGQTATGVSAQRVVVCVVCRCTGDANGRLI